MLQDMLCSRLEVYSRMLCRLIFLCTKCTFVQMISQVVLSLSCGSAMMSFRTAIKTPPPWRFRSFLIAS